MTTTTEKKLAQALSKLIDTCVKANTAALHQIGMGLIDLNAMRQADEALAAHEADKQPVEDERGAFEVHAASDGLQLDRYPDGEYVSLITHRFWRCWQARAGRASAQAVPAWHELCRRLYIELFHCDQQMLQVKKYGKPVFSQGKTVRDVLADAKAALAAAPKGD